MKREYSSKIDTADFYCLPTIRAWFTCPFWLGRKQSFYN
jgi:hypothetical protein